MKYLFRLLFFLVVPLSLLGQNTTVTGTVTDPDGFAWVGGSVQFTLHNDAGGTVRQGGIPLTAAQMNKTTPLDGTGSFSISLSTNSTLTPIGTQWTLLVCPAASAPCQTFASFTAVGASMSLTTAISSQIQPLRFPAGYTARGYGDVEISPLPPPGGTYFNLQTALPRYWNGTIWTAYGTGGGGGGNPNAPANSIQFANPAVNGFASNSNLIFDPASLTFSNKLNTRIASLESIPKANYDPWDTKYSGGLAAAIAGSSGFTVTQVLQKAADYAWCDVHLGLVSGANPSITLPNDVGLNISQVVLYNGMDFGGTGFGSFPYLQHIDATKPMLRGTTATSGDTVTCPQNGLTYTPGASGGITIHNISISGMGPTSAGPQDIGIYLNGPADFAYQIKGGNQTFGAQAILMGGDGLNKFVIYAGYPGAQIAGCASFTTGALPVSSSINGSCAAVQDGGIDDELHKIYATDGAQFIGGPTVRGPGSCYPACSAIWAGQNFLATDLFAQLSDVGVFLGFSGRADNIRVDGSSMEAVRFASGGGNNVVNNINGFTACSSLSLQASYNAGIQTGCAVIQDFGQGNIINNVNMSGSGPLFGQDFRECIISSSIASGAGLGGTYGFIMYGGNPNNTSRNDMLFCGAFSGEIASGSATLPEATRELPADVPSGLVNLSGLTNVRINSGTPVTHMTGGINGQVVYITGIPGATIVPSTVGLEDIETCTGGPETFNGFNVTMWKNKAGFQAPSFGPNNSWREICNTPNQTPTHINFIGNPTPSDPAFLDIYGNTQERQQLSVNLNAIANLHGSAAPSGQYCYIEKVTYPDGSYTTSNASCNNIDLTHLTPGGIFAPGSPNAINYELYLSSNTTTSGLPLGKYPPYGGAPGQIYWDGPTVLSHGGDGTTPPLPDLNYTGMYKAPWGVLLNTFNNTQPACDAVTRGRIWLVDGAGSNPDVYQGCISTGGSSYQWIALAFGSTGTTGFIPLFASPTTLSNSHINETANSGYETITQPIIINDPSGNGGFSIATEGTAPTLNNCSTTGTAGIDCLWSDSTKHQWLMNNNAQGIIPVVGASGTITSGHCAQFNNANGTLVDAGAACGSGGGGITPGAPTLIADAGAGTTPVLSFVAGASDFSGYINLTLGTCSGGTCGTTANQGVVDIRNSKFLTGGYSPQLRCFIQPANVAAQSLATSVQFWTPLNQQTGLKFTIVSGTSTTGLPQSTALVYYYHCDYQ